MADQCILPSQFGVVGDGITDDTVAMTNFFLAIVAGDCGRIPAGCWPRITSAIVINLPNSKHFYLAGAGSGICGIRFSGIVSTFIQFNYANLNSSVSIKDITLAVDTNNDASGCISLYGVGFAAPGNAAQNIFENVVFRGWDGRVQTNYWGFCVFAHLVSNVLFSRCGFWGPNDLVGKGKQVIVTGEATDPNPYAVHFDFDTCYFTQFDQAITVGTYAQGVTVRASNFNNGTYGIFLNSGQVANDIINVCGGSQFNTWQAGICCFEDEATLAVSETTFVITHPGNVGIRTSSRYGRFQGNHFEGIGSPSSTAGIDFIDGAKNNIVLGNVFSYLPLGIFLRTGSLNNSISMNRYDSVSLSISNSGMGNLIGVVTD